MRFVVLIEPAGTNLSAHVPDLPGCVATGKTQEEVKRNIQAAIRMHIKGLKAEGMAVPQPSTICDYVDAG
jgi:predicted RNase H-like HicB family nuclease